MELYIEDEVNYKFDFDVEAVGKQVVHITLEGENCPYEAEVSLLLTDDESIQDLNLEYRNLNSPTDVLSFPVNDRTGIVELFSIGEADEVIDFNSSFHPESGRLILGDIVISVDTLLRQAKEYGHSNKREFAFLIVHSMLHLLGYDHLEEVDQRVMEEKQTSILEGLGICR